MGVGFRTPGHGLASVQSDSFIFRSKSKRRDGRPRARFQAVRRDQSNDWCEGHVSETRPTRHTSSGQTPAPLGQDFRRKSPSRGGVTGHGHAPRLLVDWANRSSVSYSVRRHILQSASVIVARATASQSRRVGWASTARRPGIPRTQVWPHEAEIGSGHEWAARPRRPAAGAS